MVYYRPSKDREPTRLPEWIELVVAMCVLFVLAYALFEPLLTHWFQRLLSHG